MSDYADFVPWDWNVEIPGLTTRDAVRLLLDSRSLGLSEWLGYASSHTHVRWVMNAGGCPYVSCQAAGTDSVAGGW